MPFASNRGQRIHYTVQGSGPLVVLQHGLFRDAGIWTRNGIAEALSHGFRVACVDSLGHGLSDKPSDPSLYDQEQRAGDIIAVINDLESDRAHLIGYSMGGWLSVGVAKHHPGRLSSLIVGGWDPVSGLPPGPSGALSFRLFMWYVRTATPAAVQWIRPEFEPGLQACFEALDQRNGAKEAVSAATFPVMIWVGRDDPRHDPLQAFALDNGLSFLSVAGDHDAVDQTPAIETAESIRAFIEHAHSGPERSRPSDSPL